MISVLIKIVVNSKSLCALDYLRLLCRGWYMIRVKHFSRNHAVQFQFCSTKRRLLLQTQVYYYSEYWFCDWCLSRFFLSWEFYYKFFITFKFKWNGNFLLRKSLDTKVVQFRQMTNTPALKTQKTMRNSHWTTRRSSDRYWKVQIGVFVKCFRFIGRHPHLDGNTRSVHACWT